MEGLEMLDKLQEAVMDDSRNKISAPKENYHFDKLKMYFGEDFKLKDGIVISQPTIGDILETGEENFYHSLTPFLYNSTSIRLQLWEAKPRIDWNHVKDIEVFAILIPMVDKMPLKLLFKDIHFEDFTLVNINDTENEEQPRLGLYSASQNILLNESEYMLAAEYIRTMLNSHPKIEKAKGKTAKNWIIQEDRLNLQQRLNENKTNFSTLLPLISSCINHPGFKYKLHELKEVGICQFMDSVQRIQKYESSISALRGCYSGFVDTKKMDKETFNFMGDI